jgi:hypothetical protein
MLKEKHAKAMAAMLVFQTKEIIKIRLNWNTNMAAVTSYAISANALFNN